MSSKAQVNKALILSKENFSKFTKITKDNVNEFYYNNSIFIVYEINGDKHTLKHTFNGRLKPHIKGINTFHYLFDGTISAGEFKCFKSETKEEYNESMSDFYPYLLEQIKKGVLYAIKIN